MFVCLSRSCEVIPGVVSLIMPPTTKVAYFCPLFPRAFRSRSFGFLFRLICLGGLGGLLSHYVITSVVTRAAANREEATEQKDKAVNDKVTNKIF